jgi:hypothetical protein
MGWLRHGTITGSPPDLVLMQVSTEMTHGGS